MTVRVVTDSVADLPDSVVRELDIVVVPLSVRFGTDVYRDRIDLTPEQFYRRIKQDKVIFPVTSVPSPVAYADVYDRLAAETDEILVISFSSRLSANYDVAVQSIGLMKPKCQVEVIDSRWAVMAQGFIVIASAKAAKSGAGLDEVTAVARYNINRVDFRASFDTLEYLRRGGRIGTAQAFLGSMLKINPIITLKDGLVEPVGRTRSRAKAIENLYEFATGYANIEEIAVEDADCADEAGSLVERLGSLFPRERIFRSKLSPVIGTHTGPGLVLVAILGDKK